MHSFIGQIFLIFILSEVPMRHGMTNYRAIIRKNKRALVTNHVLVFLSCFYLKGSYWLSQKFTCHELYHILLKIWANRNIAVWLVLYEFGGINRSFSNSSWSLCLPEWKAVLCYVWSNSHELGSYHRKPEFNKPTSELDLVNMPRSEA